MSEPTMFRDLIWIPSAVLVGCVLGCGGNGLNGGGGASGTNGSGGAIASGGRPGSGGATPTGGMGNSGTGGARATGGSPATGGAGFGGVGGTLGPVNATVTIDASSRFQIMEGFGGALAFYVNYLTEHPNRAEIYDLIFRDLGLDILRIGNWYQTLTVDQPTVAVVAAAAASLGHPPRLLMSSWSPPASLKSNASTTNGGTLVQQNGAFAYDQFAQWWVNSLQAYAARGVRPDFISIQNEPDYKAAWETCLLRPTEGIDAANGGISVAGYDKALQAVYARVQNVNPAPAPVPRLVAPEVTGIGSMKVQDYLMRLNPDHFAAVAHHLYNGGTETAPDTFNTTFQAVASAAGNKPRFMTEFAPMVQDMFTTAWLINNAVTVENVSAYIYWDLTWASPGGLVTTENPFERATWTTTKGYTVRDAYYALKHYARWVDTGWVRVAATASSAAVKASAFMSPDGRLATVVLLNTGTTSQNVALATGTWTVAASNVFRTAGATERTREVGPLATGGVLALPSRGIV
ncbi:MAG: hypothetical protein H7X95_01695, partial [Deltaproteobacteria bacterium]|nr:hypothetical protein [Deltaproteobacteria bacterium]